MFYERTDVDQPNERVSLRAMWEELTNTRPGCVRFQAAPDSDTVRAFSGYEYPIYVTGYGPLSHSPTHHYRLRRENGEPAKAFPNNAVKSCGCPDYTNAGR